MSKAKPEYVWIVESGEQHEGGECIGVFRRYADARKRALAETTTFGGDWKRSPRKNRWLSGSDYVDIRKMVIR